MVEFMKSTWIQTVQLGHRQKTISPLGHFAAGSNQYSKKIYSSSFLWSSDCLLPCNFPWPSKLSSADPHFGDSPRKIIFSFNCLVHWFAFISPTKSVITFLKDSHGDYWNNSRVEGSKCVIYYLIKIVRIYWKWC